MDTVKQTLVLANLPILVVAVYTWHRFSSLQGEFRIFSWFIFLSTLVQLSGLGLWFFKLNNMPLLHFYTASGTLLLVYFYSRTLNGLISTQIWKWLSVAFLAFVITDSYFFEKITTFNSNALTVQCILLVIISLTTFIVLLDETVQKSKKGVVTSLFWINTGVFIYFSSDLLLFYFADLLSTLSVELFRQTWILHSVFSSIMYTCFFIGLWKLPKKSNF